MYKFFFKRVIDFVFALIILIITSPLFLVVFFLLLILNRGNVFFFQERPGRNCKSFKIVKFKSMSNKHDEFGKLLPDVERITKFGSLIRKLSIDELPQLLNVLKGDMSLIGPRPLLLKYIPLYSQDQLRRHEVRPGITGWAQVNGRNSISWTRKFELDLEYIEKMSLAMDLKIFFLTIIKILKSEGVNQSEKRPMFPFDGKN